MTTAKTPLRLGRLAALGVALAALLFATSALAASFDVNDTTWEGCSELLDIAKQELGAARVQPVGVLDWSEVRPEDGVLVLHPLQGMDSDETASFMKAGGRLAILDDYGRGDETLERFKIERTTTPTRPIAALRNNPELAIAEPVIDVVAGRNQGPHPVVANVQRLVTNHATALRHPNLSPVLHIRAIGEPSAVIAVAGQVGKGRLFAMSDPSAVINMMLRYPGNRAFVAGLARYLVDAEGRSVEPGARASADPPPRAPEEPKPGQARPKGRLFIVANRFKEEGAYGGDTTLKKELESWFRGLASALDDVRRDGFPPWLDVTIAALTAAAIAAWIARASARPYKGPVPRYARRTPLVAQGGVAGRFALLASPSSPRSLALMEQKSALYEAVTLKLDLPAEPTPDALLGHLRKVASVDAGALAELAGVLATFQRVEASMVAGRPVPVTKATLVHAAGVVRDVLRGIGHLGGGALASGPDPARAMVPGAEVETRSSSARGEGAA